MDPVIRIELKRKAIHLFALVIPLGFLLLPAPLALPILFAVSFVFILAEILRFSFPDAHNIFMNFFGYLMRDHEAKVITGASALLIASSSCALFLANFKGGMEISYNARLAFYFAFSFLILGDAAAAIFGRMFGKIRLVAKKTLAGTLACFLMCCLIYLISINFLTGPVPFWVILIGALLTAILELIDIPIDDNLRVPVVTCMVMYYLLQSGVVG